MKKQLSMLNLMQQTLIKPNMEKHSINDIVSVTIEGQRKEGRVTAVASYPDGAFYDIDIEGTLFKGVSERDIL